MSATAVNARLRRDHDLPRSRCDLARSRVKGGRREALPVPFVAITAYFAVNRTVYDADQAYFDGIWAEIPVRRAATDWNKTEKRLLGR
jgi:hypothetical protein